MATYDDEIFSRVLFTTGEGVDERDFNILQQKLMARTADVFGLGGIAAAIGDAGDLDTVINLEGPSLLGLFIGYEQTVVFTPQPWNGFWFAGTANQLQFCPGPLLYFLDEPGPIGTDPTSEVGASNDARVLYSYPQFAPLTTAVGDATNPRFDLVEIKMEFDDGLSQSRDFEDAITRAKTTTSTDKFRFVKITYQIKAGTPAANPVYPTCTAGFLPMCAVYIPATHNAVHDPSNIRDMRYPLGIRAYDVQPSQFYYPGATPWTKIDGATNLEAYAASPDGGDEADLFIPCPIGTASARVVGLGLYGRAGGAPAVDLVRVEHNLPSTPTVTVLCSIDPGSILDTAGYYTLNHMQLQDVLSTVTSHITVRTNGTSGWIGPSLWANSFAGGMAMQRSAQGDSPRSQLMLRVHDGDSQKAYVSFARWFLAEGM